MAIIRVQIEGAKEVAIRMGIMPQKLKSLDNSFWSRKLNEYKRLAKWIISDVVYYAYSPEIYQRTKKLRDSVKTDKISNGMLLYQDSTLTRAKSPGSFTSYSFYFIYGGGFLEMKNAMPVRDFLSAWYKYFSRQVRRDYNNEVVKPALGLGV